MIGPLASRRIGRRGLLAAAAATAAVAGTGLPAPPAHAMDMSGGLGNRYRLQRRFVERRFGMFIHFNMGTFHDAEWVAPNQDPATFDPTALDCGQWADAAASAGMTFAVLTAKHHDGFCLWPSKHTTYDVMSSPHRRDVVAEFVDAFRARDITPCLYFSIWDRTNGVGPPGWDEPAPIGREQIDFIKGQLTELLTGYGQISLLIFDGWAWHPRLGHQRLPFDEIRNHVTALQPDCLVFDLNGLAVPWDAELLFIEETKGGVFCPSGNTYAATQGQTIVPTGWFWHPDTPSALTMTPAQIVDDHLKVLEQRYCSFILNCPPNDKGLLDDHVVATLREVGQRWRPDLSRPPLPAQPDVLRFPVTPVSATATSGDGVAAVDGHNDFGWNGQADQTLWTSAGESPQAITVDLGRVYSGIDTLTYLPRQDTETPYSLESFITQGNITGYRVSVSASGARFRQVAAGSWAPDHALKHARFRLVAARYLRLEVVSSVGGGAAIASELSVGGLNARPRPA